MKKTEIQRVGVLSDTHGLLRPEALAALQGCTHIIHAGDVGKPEILAALGGIAPLTVVRGNVDQEAWAGLLPETAVAQVGERSFYVLHDLHRLDLDPAAAGFWAVISGHSHRAVQEWREGVLYLNPGSAGPHRFGRPVSMARLLLEGERVEVEMIDLDRA